MPGESPGIPSAWLARISGAGHYPQETAADRLLPAMRQFLESTAPFHYTESEWRHRFTTRAPSPDHREAR